MRAGVPKPLLPVNTELRNLRQQLQDANKKKLQTATEYCRVLMAHEDRMGSLLSKVECIESAIEKQCKFISDAETVCQQLRVNNEADALSLKELNKKIEELEKENHGENWKATCQVQLLSQIGQGIQELKEYHGRLDAARSTLEMRRRYLHNKFQDLRGNLRVFCRVRPPIGDERAPDMTVPMEVSGDGSLLSLKLPGRTNFTLAPNSVSADDSVTSFGFDCVFGPSATQQDVFDEVSNMIQSALDGFNVSLFAYGQTESGKTFTMEGVGLPGHTPGTISAPSTGQSDGSGLGIIPRAVTLIFNAMRELASKGWIYTVAVSVFEIYNETVRDLLVNHSSTTASTRDQEQQNPSKAFGGGPGAPDSSTSQSCDIKLDSNGNAVLTNVAAVDVTRAAEVYALLKLASGNRACASTACNDRSSRSHSVFQCKILGERRSDGKAIKSLLSLVDLAGSERLDKSLVAGDRLKESQSINRSLFCLCDVIQSIAARKKHIPFRNSKLTLLLKDSLGGSAKTLMLVNISPAKKCLQETLNSLKFAAKTSSSTAWSTPNLR